MRAETLEAAASLLVLRRDTLWLIDGAGPDIEAPQSKSNGLEEASETEAEQVSSLNTEAEQPTLTPTGQVDQARSRRLRALFSTHRKCILKGILEQDECLS